MLEYAIRIPQVHPGWDTTPDVFCYCGPQPLDFWDMPLYWAVLDGALCALPASVVGQLRTTKPSRRGGLRSALPSGR